MAQAVFDDHPIEQYLREFGELSELMPGGTAEFSRESFHDPCNPPILSQWLSPLIRPLLKAAFYALDATGLRSHSPSSEFAERFKYIVISSSLLSSSLTATLPNRTATPTTPGHYDPPTVPWQTTPSTTNLTPASPSGSFLALTIAFLIPAALAQGYYISCVFMFAVARICTDRRLSLPVSLTSRRGEGSWSITLESLEMLASANDAWDSSVSEALRILEDEERNSFGSVSPSHHSPSLRVAISSSLHTTQTQCDNVRQLLSALTSPILLSQLSEMYAPPSPPPIYTPFNPRPTRPRPTSLAAPALHHSRSYSQITLDSSHTRTRTSSAPFSFPADKRSTWNGSYMSLAGVAPQRENRPSELSPIVLQSSTNQSVKGSSSVPHTPTLSLSGPTTVDADRAADTEAEPFGIMALDLRRKQQNTRSLLFEGSYLSLGSSHTPPSISSSHGTPLSPSFGSRFTTLSATASSSRHSPLSLSNIHIALHGALAARRFACAHLLALRFQDPLPDDGEADGEDEGDESYWEDVRSVIALLTSTLEDASARLCDALADATRSADEEFSVPASPEPPPPSALPVVTQSFAPVLSHTSRFAAHVDAISAALDEARQHLQASVASLQEDPSTALESYERMRRELGLALREYERGRSTLVELVHRESAHDADEVEGEEESPARRDKRHFSSGESDKTLFNVEEHPETKIVLDEPEHEVRESESVAAQERDDASAHLMMTATSQHLPPPGIEQVFESLSVAPKPFTRERSKFTREERIRLAKERRSNGSATTLVIGEAEQPRQPQEGWGPGGDVVQELKDVIWRVGEQRRKMVDQS